MKPGDDVRGRKAAGAAEPVLRTATWPDTWSRRWGGAFAVVLAAHAALLLVAMHWSGRTTAATTQQPALFIDLSPPAPPAPPAEPPPAPHEVPVDPPSKPAPPRPAVEPKVVPDPPVATPDPPQPPPPRPAMPVADAPQSQPREVVSIPPPPVAPATASPMPPAPSQPQGGGGQANWEGRVLAHLHRYKRYPRAAQFNRREGVPWVRIILDRQGRVLSSRLDKGSGVRSLDDEALALLERAQPLPPPPDNVRGERIELVVPIEFFLRKRGR